MLKEDDTYVIQGPEPLEPIPNITLGKLLHDGLVANWSEREALIEAISGKSISYRKLLETTSFLAKSLKSNGYAKNTIVSISSENNTEFFIPIIACFYLGCIVAPINHNYTEHETRHCLNICQPKIIFCSKAASSKFVLLRSKLSYLEKIIVIDTDDDVYGTESLQNFIARSLTETEFKLEHFDGSQLALIMCSSGTTGLPKGVMLTHRNLMVRYMHTKDPRYTPNASRFLGVLPFFHIYGLLTNLFSIALGQQIVILKKFEEEHFLKTVQNYKISALWLVPPLVVFLEKSPLVDKYDLSSVEDIISGAAPLSKETEEAVKRRLNVARVRQGYGLTETPLAVTLISAGDAKPGSIGKAVTYVSCKVRDPKTGKSLKPRQVGELCFKGPMVMGGYYKNEEATRTSFTSDGWFLTGDLGYYDEEGYFYVVDRLKELIKYKGFQVAPAELEAVILSNPKVEDVGVVGLPDDEAGEVPLAFVVKKNPDLTESEVIDLVAEKVSSQKRLRGGVVFVSEIPRNASGKILRRNLRNMLATPKSKL